MIKLLDYIVVPTIFPDKTSQVWKLPEHIVNYIVNRDVVWIHWEFEHEAELFHVAQLNDLLLSSFNRDTALTIPYLPYGRQDKPIANDATFALETFARIINNMSFKRVETIDAHSYVAKLIHNLNDRPANWFFKPTEDIVLCFPDKGAATRYSKQFPINNHVELKKKRNQLTGEIKGLEFSSGRQERKHLDGKTFCLVDDICDGGRTFIEICSDLDSNAWVMLHSGSRNIGKTLAEKHIDNAKDLMKRYFIDLPDPDLAYLVQGTDEFKNYIRDLLWAQNYAMANRNEMMLRVLKDISYHVYKEDKGAEALTTFRVNCHHNYTQMENHYGKNVWITRKGAVSAKAGEYGIIPGSMGAKSFIVKGLGNPESFNSCSHGAGRKMSRTKAKDMFTIEDLKKQTEGVECRKDKDVVDEIPGAYKDIDQVMDNQKDLVEPVAQLKQLLYIKGN